jgi:hypothetical protein
MPIAPNADLHVWSMRRGFRDALGSAATTGGPVIEAPLADGDSASRPVTIKTFCAATD